MARCVAGVDPVRHSILAVPPRLRPAPSVGSAPPCWGSPETDGAGPRELGPLQHPIGAARRRGHRHFGAQLADSGHRPDENGHCGEIGELQLGDVERDAALAVGGQVVEAIAEEPGPPLSQPPQTRTFDSFPTWITDWPKAGVVPSSSVTLSLSMRRCSDHRWEFKRNHFPSNGDTVGLPQVAEGPNGSRLERRTTAGGGLGSATRARPASKRARRRKWPGSQPGGMVQEAAPVIVQLGFLATRVRSGATARTLTRRRSEA